MRDYIDNFFLSTNETFSIYYNLESTSNINDPGKDKFINILTLYERFIYNLFENFDLNKGTEN